jgi:O-acetylhomoserine/O-acetylserine sulfhydrylase-like pyridoxal-dependent enzyme
MRNKSSWLTIYTVLLKKFGIGVKFIVGDKPEDFAKVVDANTKAIYVESIGNPKYNVAPIPELSKVRLIPIFPFEYYLILMIH